MRTLPAPPCSRCGSTDTYAEAIEVPMAGDVPPYPVIAGTAHCRTCDAAMQASAPTPNEILAAIELEAAVGREALGLPPLD